MMSLYVIYSLVYIGKEQMDNSINNTLLALILAVKNIETPLNKEEEASLSTAAQQFSVNPQGWDIIIEPELMKMINGNRALAQEFQTIKAKLNKVSTIPSNLIPTEEELEVITSSNTDQPKGRPIPNIDPSSSKSNETTNMAIRAMLTPETSKTVKELSSLEKIWEFLNQSID